MTAVSEITAWVVLPTGESVQCAGASVTMDEGWAPTVRASVDVPWTAGRASALDPRSWSRIRLDIIRSWAYRATLQDLTDQWAGLTLGDLSTAWAGLTLGDLTDAWTEPWESGTRAPDYLQCDLIVRSTSADHRADTLTISASSDEALAMGARIEASRPTESLQTRLLVLLALAGISYTSADFTAGAAISVPPVVYDVTKTVWSIMADLAAASSLRLWCDHGRVWRLAAPTALDPTTLTLTRASRATDDTDVDGEYADVLVWRGTAEARMTDGTDEWFEPVAVTQWWPASPSLAPHVVHLWEEDFGRLDVSSIPIDFYPSDAQMAARLARLSSRGRVLTITAPLDPTARIGQPIVTGPPSMPAMEGVVASVTLSVPEDIMNIRTRSTVDEE